MTRAMLIGATGLVGQAVLVRGRALGIIALARRQGAHGGADIRVAPPGQWAAMVAAEPPELLINCLGTTIKAAGSQAAFRAVDHDLALGVAAAARSAGTRRMITVSSVGASRSSGNFYLRTKGEVEAALGALGFDRLDILRPGLLIGPRSERRPGEALAQQFAPFTDLVMHGPLRRYRSVSATAVADAVIALAHRSEAGQFVHEHDAIMAAASGGSA